MLFRSVGADTGNRTLATLVAYDLQSGSYAAYARQNPEERWRWTEQLAALIDSVLPTGGSLLEVGVGEATTLSAVMQALEGRIGSARGFDLSWSRLHSARRWCQEERVTPDLFVGDLFHIPLQDQSINVVYSSHSLEPNGGREREAIAECLRVARTAVVLVEPLYELASLEARARMEFHGYVRGLKEAAESLGASVRDYRLLPFTHSHVNPSGVLILAPPGDSRYAVDMPPDVRDSQTSVMAQRPSHDGQWQCPLTGAALERGSSEFFAADVGLAYPVLDGIPLLRAEHAVVASLLRR